ncbi:hypothetical protein BGZ61DRAFT_469394 [Ilyonectria robusta]|uniref:uncharacterized protein n=1 Tax=Ilyonectria robusta TaxID=1079257 RepID=UPI001E8E9C71|nr:uncharacterized protein BGZ61DRAFT_469394 [Ilyonectria robusta]KAH8650413.1 hypothetical protein BGZ61DRAFT_469394 [Ilyonectria robusta]
MINGKELCALPSLARPSAARVDGVMRDISPSEDYYGSASSAGLFFGSPGSVWYPCGLRIGKEPEYWWIWRILCVLGILYSSRVCTSKDIQER